MTAVITLSVKPEQEADHHAWQKRIRDAAAEFPGYLGGENFAPVRGLQDEWVNVLRFDTAQHLRDWLESEIRIKLLDEARIHFNHPPEVQQISGGQTQQQRVSVVFSKRIRPGCLADFRVFQQRLQDAIRQAPGFETLETFPSVEGVQEEWVEIAHFKDPASREAWIQSPERADALAAVEPFVENARIRRVGRGFDAWFPARGEESPPEMWRQALVVLFCLYPSAMLVSHALVSTELARPTTTLLSNLIVVIFLNWVAMRLANQALGFFLRPGEQKTLSAVAGVGVIAAWLLGWMVFWLWWG